MRLADGNVYCFYTLTESEVSQPVQHVWRPASRVAAKNYVITVA
jgi:hypothetical protein